MDITPPEARSITTVESEDVLGFGQRPYAHGDMLEDSDMEEDDIQTITLMRYSTCA
jgi:hypothetical protein